MWILDGLGEGRYAEPRAVFDSDGNPVRVGRLVSSDLIGDEKDTNAPHPKEHGLSVAPCDWDGDGDFDLLLGTRKGKMYLCINEGSATNPQFARCGDPILAGGEPLVVPGGSAMPVVADWDGDGRRDLVSGSDDGPVYWFRNVGENGAMVFATGEKIVDCEGTRTQVAVADHNAGLLTHAPRFMQPSAHGSAGKRRVGLAPWSVSIAAPVKALHTL